MGASSDVIPQLASVRDVYAAATVDAEEQRWAALRESFRKTYARDADFVARAPGRVNLIGEYVRML